MKLARKNNRPQNPPLTRRQLDQVVGKAITDFLLREPKQTHYHDSTAQGIIEDVLEILAKEPFY